MPEQDNVELARRAYEAFRRGDRATWLALHDADFEVVPIPDWPEPGVRGREAAWDFYVDLFGAFDRAPIEPGDFDFVDAGGDSVLIHHRLEVRGRGSGVDVEADYWLVVTVRQEGFVRAQFFANRADALAAAGLGE